MVKSYTAASLQEALKLRKENPNLVPYVGGTDLMVWAEDDAYLFLHKVPEMKKIVEDDEYIRFGASCTFTEIIENSLSPEILKKACLLIGSPAIRNAGSIGGNIGNGSPKADSALVFMVTDSKLRIASVDGERIIPIKDFYQGRKNLNITKEELIVEVLMPKHGLENYYHEKVGARKSLAISRVSFAGIMDIEDDQIKNCATAFGAVSDVIIREESIDRMLIGKTIDEAKNIKEEYLKSFDKAIVPIRGRVGIEYRKDVCMNLLKDFLNKNGI